jgi:hypothetical protein
MKSLPGICEEALGCDTMGDDATIPSMRRENGLDHTWQSITVQEIAVSVHPSDVTVAHVIPMGEAETRYGCTVCNMGLDIALTIPCPGRTLQQMWDAE